MVDIKFKPGMRKINPGVVDMVTTKLESTNLDNYSSRLALAGWLNGVASAEKVPELKVELKRIRQILQTS